MSGYSAQFKRKVVSAYLSRPASQREIAALFKISRYQLYSWLLSYQTSGELALVPCKTHRTYSSAFKVSVLTYKRKHAISLPELALHFNIPSASTIYTWEQRYTQGGIDALVSHRGAHKMKKPKNPKDPQISNKSWSELTPAELLREVEYLQAENAYLKKLDALIQEKKSAQKIKPTPSGD